MSIDPNGPFTITSYAQSGVQYAVDVTGGSTQPGTPVIAYAPGRGANQQWLFELAVPGSWLIRSQLAAGLYLTIDAATGGLVVDGAQSGNSGQLWSLVTTGSAGYWYIQSQDPDGPVASVPDPVAQGSQLVTAPRSYTAFQPQAWAFAPVGR